MFLDCPDGIVGAGRIEATLVTPPRAQQVSVATNGRDQQVFHLAGAILDELVEVRADFSEEGRRIRIVEPLAQHHYAIETGKFQHMTAKGLAHKALHPIPVH